jgi:hypothetical protein
MELQYGKIDLESEATKLYESDECERCSLPPENVFPATMTRRRPKRSTTFSMASKVPSPTAIQPGFRADPGVDGRAHSGPRERAMVDGVTPMTAPLDEFLKLQRLLPDGAGSTT